MAPINYQTKTKGETHNIIQPIREQAKDPSHKILSKSVVFSILIKSTIIPVQ